MIGILNVTENIQIDEAIIDFDIRTTHTHLILFKIVTKLESQFTSKLFIHCPVKAIY